MSALYLSKMAAAEQVGNLRIAQDQTKPGKQGKPTKMVKDFQQVKDDPVVAPSAGEHATGSHTQPSTPAMLSQPSRAMLHQQRQKCELRRLLKHTQPELKMLDGLMDEELAEVLRPEGGLTTAESGYEGEVFSRRWMFESCSLGNKEDSHAPKKHIEDEPMERGDVKRTSALFEQSNERLHKERAKVPVEVAKSISPNPDPNEGCEKEISRVDVHSTRRVFESKSLESSQSSPKKVKGNIQDRTRAVQKPRTEIGMCGNQSLPNNIKGWTNVKREQGQCVKIFGQSNEDDFFENVNRSKGVSVVESAYDNRFSLPNSGSFEEKIQTSKALFQNNPFISTNIEKTQSNHSSIRDPESDSRAIEDTLTTNVKNRAQLFESMPFDKIRHQNKEEMDTIVHRINETLNSLCHFGAIHSHGSVIEVNETMLAKKANYTISQSGPQIEHGKVAEGGAQNFIVQLLPRAKLKPKVVYLKEDNEGNVEISVVEVPVHKHHFTTKQDVEFKTANVVQLIEDILNQDNSLTKGVIIQQDGNSHSEVTVYSLYNYAEGDVKSYCPPQGLDREEYTIADDVKTYIHNIRKADVKSTTSCLLTSTQDQTSRGSMRPEVKVKGNVKLFRSCIEKGDLEYLKTLRTDSREEELLSDQTQAVSGACMENSDKLEHQLAEGPSECSPVDLSSQKNAFSADQRNVQPKHGIVSSVLSTKCENEYICQEQEHGDRNTPQGSGPGPGLWEEDDTVHQAELVEIVDEEDEMLNLQAAIHSLQQATMDAKALHQAIQDKARPESQNLSKQHPASVSKCEIPTVEEEVEAGRHQEKEQEQKMCYETLEPPPSVSGRASEHEPERQHGDVDTESGEKPSTGVSGADSQQGTEAAWERTLKAKIFLQDSKTKSHEEEKENVVSGNIQTALKALERSSVNVSRGDFRAAMIYRNSYKSCRQRCTNVDAVSSGKCSYVEFDPSTESTEGEQEAEGADNLIGANAKPPGSGQTTSKPATGSSSKNKIKTVDPKPAIPPKPEHVRAKHIGNLSTSIQQHVTTEMEKHGKEEKPPQALSSVSDKQTSLSIKAADTMAVSKLHEINETVVKTIQIPEEIQLKHQDQSLIASLKTEISEVATLDKTLVSASNEIVASEKMCPQNSSLKGNDREAEGGREISVKNVPPKPKRVRITHNENNPPKHHTSRDNNSIIQSKQSLSSLSNSNLSIPGQIVDKSIKQTKVVMRQKKLKQETEDERRLRLSVHMDEIMKGNISTALVIFDNLLKQEELQDILCRVKEIEQDTSSVDVRSLRGIFENVPGWVATHQPKKQTQVKVEDRVERKDEAERKFSMAHVFGDLERASEEIMNLKEQTLARLVDIEEAIRKAIYSVSTLKSDSDIAGLSSLFKESLGTVQGSPTPGNIQKISIGSRRTKMPPAQESSAISRDPGPLYDRIPGQDVHSARQGASPPSSPVFISIQSAARKEDKAEGQPPETTTCPTCQASPKGEEKFRTTRTLKCKGTTQYQTGNMVPGQGAPKQTPTGRPLTPQLELSILEVQTNPKGVSVVGTNTVRENYERMDDLGNCFYSSTTSTFVTTQPESLTTYMGQIVASPATHQVTMYPEVRLPINSRP